MTTPTFKTNPLVTSLASFIEMIEAEREAQRNDGIFDAVLSTQKDRKVDFLFRGQSADWSLISKLARMKWYGNDILNSEKIMLEEFDRVSARFNIGIADVWDRMAVAQHHQLPTRYIDFSYNALSALWMAVKDGIQKDANGSKLNGVVWLLKPRLTDFLSVKSRFEYTPSTLPHSSIFRSRVIAERINAQSGIFVVHTMVEDKFIPLEINSAFTSRLVKIPIPHERFEPLRRELHVCGVNDATMFPDLDGLSRHLAWRYADGQHPTQFAPS